jgi:hypothetical protein
MISLRPFHPQEGGGREKGGNMIWTGLTIIKRGNKMLPLTQDGKTWHGGWCNGMVVDVGC